MAALENREFSLSGGIGVRIGWDRGQLPRFWQWRMLGQGMYLTGVEPANCGIRGRAEEMADEQAHVEIIQPGSERRFSVSITAAIGIGEVAGRG